MSTNFWLWNFLDPDPGPRGPVLFPRVIVMSTTQYCQQKVSPFAKYFVIPNKLNLCEKQMNR